MTRSMQVVPMTGSAMAIASTMGRPQPSPRVGSTKKSIVRYTDGKSTCCHPTQRRQPATGNLNGSADPGYPFVRATRPKSLHFTLESC